MIDILVLGFFGFKTNQLDGQTVKTRNLLTLLQSNGFSCDFYDTQDFKYSKLSLFTMFKKIICSKKIYYLPAHNNLKLLFPVIFILSILFRVKIYYFVVGGWLPEFIKNKPIHRWMLRRVFCILSETQYLCIQLNKLYRFNNLDFFPNFRFYKENIQFKEDTFGKSNQLRLVFMSRVVKEKGLEVIEYLCKYILNNHLDDNIKISFFGPIAEKDKDYFTTHLCIYPFVEYKGVLQPNQIIETLTRYDVLLLPTRYYTEGLPGAIVDAYMAGLPVIVTEWKHATEFVKNGETGFIVPFSDPNVFFIKAVMQFYNNKKMLKEMKKNAFKLSYIYSDKYALEKLLKI